MPKFFVDNSNIDKYGSINILGDDVNHIKNVLRMHLNDNINICNKDTSENFLCEIKKISDYNIECMIIEKLNIDTESNIKIDLFQGIPKVDKMEMIIQKSTELGINKIIPTIMKRCVVKIDKKDEIKKMLRWQNIAEVASKQCGRNIIPNINNLIAIKNMCEFIKDYDMVIVAYEKEEKNSIKQQIQALKSMNLPNYKIGIVVGPEGGIDEEEINLLIKNNAKIVTLGNRILRTETVAFVLLSIFMYELGDLN